MGTHADNSRDRMERGVAVPGARDPLNLFRATDRQLQILRMIGEAISRGAPCPTIREIGEAFGIRSTNGVNDHLKALEKKGLLERAHLRTRSLAPTMLGWVAINIPAPAWRVA